MTMSIFSGLTVPKGQKEDRRMVNGEVVKFKYPEVVSDNYRYRGCCIITMTLGIMTVLNTRLVWRLYGERPGGLSEFLLFS